MYNIRLLSNAVILNIFLSLIISIMLPLNNLYKKNHSPILLPNDYLNSIFII